METKGAKLKAVWYSPISIIMSQNLQYFPSLKKVFALSTYQSTFFIITVPSIVKPETVKSSFAFAS